MTYTFLIHPSHYDAFTDEEATIQQCKQWGLLSEKATQLKTFYYRGNGMDVVCHIVGLVDKITAVIQLEAGQLHTIHPSYLKEMQAASFGQRISAISEPAATIVEDTDTAAINEKASTATIIEKADTAAIVEKADTATIGEKTSTATIIETADTAAIVDISEPPAEEVSALPTKTRAKKEKTPKLELPEEKVKMTATVKEFTTVPNNFSDNDDEVIIYEAVSIEDPAIEVGDAWSSHSATLKKLELEIGDTLQFEGKIVAKKLTKHPIPYKINNPSKLQKL